MAGMITGRNRRSKRGKRVRASRFRIITDLTPMVDIVMLMLIFYMVTTIFSMPQAMEINQPKSEGGKRVRHVLTILIDRDNHVWYHTGVASKANLPVLIESPAPNTSAFPHLREKMSELNRANSKLNTVIKIHPKARYSLFFDILDEIELTERRLNLFRARKLGISLQQLLDSETFREHRFSYRYAMDIWTNRENKLITDAKASR